MRYDEFKIMIQERLQTMLGESVEVKIESYYKNNQTRVESLTFKEKNPVSKIIFSPAIHLQDIYRLYIINGDGEELADCLRQIQRLYEEQEPKSIKRFPEDWNEVKKQIFVHPISKTWNQEWLGDGEIPFQEYLDFAIILRRNLKVTAHGTGSIVINREMISLMNVSEEEIWERAWKNLRHEKFFIQDINEAIRLEDSKKEIKQLDFKVIPSMHVMSNKGRDYGARAILRTDLLRRFAKKADCNLFILPSSVHEIIIMPDDGKIEADRLRKDVREINAACVAEQERLSEEVYYFRKDADTVEIAK